jgi:hypothetical protein
VELNRAYGLACWTHAWIQIEADCGPVTFFAVVNVLGFIILVSKDRII